MAVQYGSCGSLKSVLRSIKPDLSSCASLSELNSAVAQLEQQRPNWPELARIGFERHIAKLKGEIPILNQAAASVLEKIHRQIKPELQDIHQSLNRLKTDRSFFIRWINEHFRAPPLRRRERVLMDYVNRQTQPTWHAFATARNELIRLLSDPQAEIAKIINQLQHKLDRLNKILASPEYAGAIAECEQADVLKNQLGNEYIIFHDVEVHTSKWVYDGREHRKSAQIDHLVIGPGGIFVIETKRWSRSFVKEGHYHDPYQQVRWAGKLLHLVLSDRFGRKIRVREIISTTGSIPPKPSDSFAKVLRPTEISGYIQWFKSELDNTLIRQLVSVLEKMC